jgi:hypothetical protein
MQTAPRMAADPLALAPRVLPASLAGERVAVAAGTGLEAAVAGRGGTPVRVDLQARDGETALAAGPAARALVGPGIAELRDPVGALEHLRLVLAPGATLHVVAGADLRLTVRHPRRALAVFEVLGQGEAWWTPNLRALRAWVETAGFTGARTTRLGRPAAGTLPVGLSCTSPS